MIAEATTGASSALRPSGRYDAAERRRALRTGRERGCWLYIPADELQKTGVDPHGERPFYRVWGAPRGRIVVQLYRSRRPARGGASDGLVTGDGS